jgi:hypothetical protein
MFSLSQTEPEKNHIISALVFELSKAETPAIRERVGSHLVHVDAGMAKRVAAGLRLRGGIEPAPTKVPAGHQIELSPALSIVGKAQQTLKPASLVSSLATVSTVRSSRSCVRRCKRRGLGSRSSRRMSVARRPPMERCSRPTSSSLAHPQFFATQWP